MWPSFGTVVAFLCSLSPLLVAGSGVAMYVSVLSPLGALVVSIALEGLRPEVPTMLGMMHALGGAWVRLRTPAAPRRAAPAVTVDKLHTAPHATDRIAPGEIADRALIGP